jgi:hypothetical protein
MNVGLMASGLGRALFDLLDSSEDGSAGVTWLGSVE